jgi:hypothetical protein
MNEQLVKLDRMLASHDWYYDYSDDHSVWCRGRDQRAAINAEQRRLIAERLADPTELVALADKYRPKNI